MSDGVRQLDIGPPAPLKGKRPVNAPIPGSTRDKVAQQTNAILPGAMRDIAGTPSVAVPQRKPNATAMAWGETASTMGYALALTLRSKPFKWLMRVLMLVTWFMGAAWLSGAITLVAMGWAVLGVAAWTRRKAGTKKGLDKCQCQGAC